MKQILFILSIIGAFIIFCFSSSFAQAPLIFGCTPFKSPKVLKQNYKPLMDYLTSTLNRKVVLFITEDYADLTQKIKARKIDVAHMSPNAYVQTKNEVPDLKYLFTIQKKIPKVKFDLITMAYSSFPNHPLTTAYRIYRVRKWPLPMKNRPAASSFPRPFC